MSESLHGNRFAGESDEYRAARNELLREEIKLRKQIEEVAARRRELPLGGKIKEDYVFDEGGASVKLSDLFAEGKDTLMIYSFMYSADMPRACPSCTSILDSLDASHKHLNDRINVAVVAKSPYERIKAWAEERNWRDLRLLSSEANTYNADYFAEHPDWGQMPAVNIFVQREGEIFHFYSTELLYAPSEEGQHPRHADMFWPVWNVLDMTPEGRGEKWLPKLYYQ